MSYSYDPRNSLIRGDSDRQPFVGGYQQREGLTSAEGLSSRSRKMYKPDSTWTWAFMLTALAQAAIVLAIESYLFANFQESLQPGDPTPLSKTIPTYLTLFIFGFLYEVLLVWDALRLKNTIQIIGLCLYNGGMLIYAAIQYDQIKDAILTLAYLNMIKPEDQYKLLAEVKPYLIASPCITAFFTVVMSFEAWKLYDEFAWTIYKQISADLRMKRRFLTFQIYITLLKFDFFFFLGFAVQFLVVVTNLGVAERALTIAAVPITVIILLMAAFWTRRENKIGMIGTIILFFCGLAYFIFKLVRMYQPQKAEDYMAVRKSLTSFAVITIILIILTIVNAIMCTSNFGMGLKAHIMKRKMGGEEAEIMKELPDHKHGPVSSRMTID